MRYPGYQTIHVADHNHSAERVRDVSNAVDIPMTIGHYLRSLDQLTNQFTPQNYRDPKRQRLYLKDIDTPEVWTEQLKNTLPEAFFYLNDCIEARTGGDGAIREPNEYGQMRFGNGVAPAGDLMSSLPDEMRAQNMMCYIGHEGTFTPAHREMCASLGHNIMVEASTHKKGEKAGSSIWLMTETKERELVSEYFLSMLGHDIEVEKHFAQVNAWKKAPFNVWVVEQKVGDLILIPPLAPHQVWNRGTRTMKAAWNRTTVDTLELAIHEALPRARLVCRDEQYKNKAIIYYTLNKYYDLLERDTVEPKMWKYGRIKQLLEDFKRLFALYTEVLVSEMFSPTRPREKNVEYLEYDSNVTCSYCRCNIFNRFLTCEYCIERGDNGAEDTYDICMECYAMGRSCACISKLKWVEQWPESELTQNYEKWRNVVVQYDGYFDLESSPQPLEVARKRYGKKPVAEICQEQLAIRPWNDIRKEAAPEVLPGDSDDEPEVDDEGRLKKPKKLSKYRVKPQKNKTKTCHICFHHDWNWKLAFCTSCNSAYCYGVLYRAFDLMPQTVMEDKEWKCPKCLKICSCGKCRRTPAQKPYSPKGTLLGHDTRKVADYRSVESLVDFSKTNLIWLRGDNDTSPHESARMKKLKEKAEAEKAKEDTIDESFLENSQQEPLEMGDKDAGGETEPHDEGMAEIDPLLRDSISSRAPPRSDNGLAVKGTVDHDANGYNNTPQPTTPYPSNGLLNGEHGVDTDSDAAAAHNVHWGAEYPSRLLAPVANMAGESSYPDPSTMGQGRMMMGAGYYQQDSNTIDRILYDAPNGEDDLEPQAPEQSDFLKALLQDDKSKKRKRVDEDGNEDVDDEDLEFFTSKKQRKLEQSKKQRVVTDRPKPTKPTEDDDPSISLHRPSRPSAGQRQVFGDVIDVDAVMKIPEEDLLLPNEPKSGETDLELAMKAMSRLRKTPAEEQPASRGSSVKRSRPTRSSLTKSPAPTSTGKPSRHSAWLARKEAQEAAEAPAGQRRRGRPRKSLQDLEPAGSAAPESDVSDDEIPAKAATKRGRPRRSLTSPAANMSPVEETAPPSTSRRSRPRNSLQDIEPRMGASVSDVSDDEIPAKAPAKPGRPRRSLTSPAANISSDEEATPPSTSRRGRPRKAVTKTTLKTSLQVDGTVDSDEEADSDVGEGQETISPGGSRKRNIEWRRSEENPEVMLGRPLPGQGVAPAKKRRGRPPKKHPVADSPVESPSPARSPSPSQMLSLKEKLALKGKSAKMVASKAHRPISSAQSTPVSVGPVNGNKKSPEIQLASPTIDEMSPAQSSPSMTPPSAKPITSRPEATASPSPGPSRIITNRLSSSSEPASEVVKKSATVVRFQSPEIKKTQTPVKKGPTVVRLGSSSEDSASERSFSDDHSSSDDDEGIPAVKPMPATSGGRGSMNGMTAR